MDLLMFACLHALMTPDIQRSLRGMSKCPAGEALSTLLVSSSIASEGMDLLPDAHWIWSENNINILRREMPILKCSLLFLYMR